MASFLWAFPQGHKRRGHLRATAAAIVRLCLPNTVSAVMRKWVVGLGLGVALGWVTGAGIKLYTGQPEWQPAMAAVEVGQAAGILAGAGSPSLAPMLKQVMPAVVNLSVRGDPTLVADPAVREPPSKPGEKAEEAPFEAAGSGVVVDARNGYVITSYHVVEQAKEVMVTLGDGTQYKADKVGEDPDTDIALVRIRSDDLSGLKSLPWGESGDLEVGDIVVAVGNPSDSSNR
jgi:S1-C subfamily serine protease